MRLRSITITIVVALVLGGLLFAILRDKGGKDSGTPTIYLIGRDPAWYSTDFLGKEREVLAFVDELLTEIAREEELNIRLVRITSDALFASLINGKVEAIITARELPRHFNQGRFIDSSLIYELGPVLIVRRDYDAENIEDLKGKVVGLERGSPLTYALQSDPDVVFVTYSNILIALERLEDQSIDAVMLPFLPASIYVNSLFRDKLRIISGPLLDNGVRMVASRTAWSEPFMEKINTGLAKLVADGRYQKLLARWNLPIPAHFGIEKEIIPLLKKPLNN